MAFFMTLFAGGDLLFWWWGDRRLRKLVKPRVWRLLLGLLVGAQFFMLVTWILFPISLQYFGTWFWKPVTAWLYMWHILVLPAALGCIAFGYAVVGLRALFAKLITSKPVAVVASVEMDDKALSPVRGPAVVYPSRRQVLTAAAAFVPQVALGGTLIESARQQGKFRIRHMNLVIPGLPRGLDGMVIAHISDTHVGRFVGPRELDAVAAATAEMKPDLIAFTGDLIDFNLADLPPAIAAFKQIQKIAPLAMCVGNHDLFADPTAFRTRVRQAELGLMINEPMRLTVRGEPVELLGLDWGTPLTPRVHGLEAHMHELLARRGSGAFSILLAHHPHAFDPAAAAGIPLTLSGHTHGGQIMLTKNIGAGPTMYRYWSGLYEQGDAKLVVSNGVGNWFPLRINAPAEIARITLRGA